MRRNKAIAYAQNALSFVFSDNELFDKIKAVYLFGSAVREELTKESDVDLFVDCEQEEFVEKRTRLAIERFYRSRDFEKWKLLGISNTFSVHAGNLAEWDLKESIHAEGILLYAKSVIPTEYERKVLIVITFPKQKTKYLKLIRELFGRPEYRTKGLLDKLSGTRISSNVLIIPQENLAQLLRTLNKQKIQYKIFEFFTSKTAILMHHK